MKIERQPKIVFIGIGSNLGDRIANCKEAIKRLEDRGIDIVKVSSLYETEPHGVLSEGWYINCVVKGCTNLEPRALLSCLEGIEREMGRTKKGDWSPRSIDLDLLFYNDLILKEEGLIIPHPLLHKRGFVLKPLVEIEPSFLHPLIGKTVERLYIELKDDRKVMPVAVAKGFIAL